MTIQSVKRALDILLLFSGSRPQLGISEISRIMDLPKPTVHGLVRTLCDQGFLLRDEQTRKYSLGLKIFELGTYLAGSLKINQVCGDIVRNLSEKTSAMVRVAIWDENSMIVTRNIVPGNSGVEFRQLGPRIPAYCSALGKAVLALHGEKELESYISLCPFKAYTPKTITDPEILMEELVSARKQEYASESEEYLTGLTCFAVPVRDEKGKPVAAVSLSGDPSFEKRKDFNQLVSMLKKAGSDISSRMGYLPGFS